MNWIAKAQQRLQTKANLLFADWLQTTAGQNWQQNWSRKPPGRGRANALSQSSPYAHGFSLPDHHHDLIEAVGRGDEERAKYIMLVHYV